MFHPSHNILVSFHYPRKLLHKLISIWIILFYFIFLISLNFLFFFADFFLHFSFYFFFFFIMRGYALPECMDIIAGDNCVLIFPLFIPISCLCICIPRYFFFFFYILFSSSNIFLFFVFFLLFLLATHVTLGF